MSPFEIKQWPPTIPPHSTSLHSPQAPDSPFFVEKLKVRMLPCVVFFLDGVAVDRVVGFDELGAKDDFKTEALEAKLLGAGVVEYVKEEEVGACQRNAATWAAWLGCKWRRDGWLARIREHSSRAVS